MVDPLPKKWQDLPESAFLLLIAGSFAGVATDALVKGDISRAVVCYLVATAVFGLGVSWHWIRRQIPGTRLANSLSAVAADARWWLGLMAIIFAYAAFPIAAERLHVNWQLGTDRIVATAPPSEDKSLPTEQGASGTRLVLHAYGYETTHNEIESKNVHWYWWNGIKEPPTIFTLNPQQYDHEALLFLTFDWRIKYDSFRIISLNGGVFRDGKHAK
jgi:hypothetical protein